MRNNSNQNSHKHSSGAWHDRARGILLELVPETTPAPVPPAPAPRHRPRGVSGPWPSVNHTGSGGLRVAGAAHWYAYAAVDLEYKRAL